MGRITLYCTLWMAVLLPVIVLSTFMSPEEIGPLCLLWFAFPYLWLLTAVFALVLACLGNRSGALVYLTLLLVSAPQASKVIGFYGTKDAPSAAEAKAMGCQADAGAADKENGEEDAPSAFCLKLLTYNVHFNFYHDEVPRALYSDSLSAFLREENPDIICMQEAGDAAQLKICKSVKKLLDDEYPHQLTRVQLNGIQAVYSRLPLTLVPDSEVVNPGNGGPLAKTITVDVQTPCGSFRLFNTHLASLGLSDDQIQAVTGKDLDKERASTLRSTLQSLMNAFRTRASEARQLSRAIESSPMPVVLCGDFNDTPTSYTYTRVSQAMPVGDDGQTISEAFRPARIGLPRTYRGKLPPLRIDYIFMSKSFTSAEYREHDAPFSDHKAVSVRLFLHRQKE